jgi:hypothetical protein
MLMLRYTIEERANSVWCEGAFVIVRGIEVQRDKHVCAFRRQIRVEIDAMTMNDINAEHEDCGLNRAFVVCMCRGARAWVVGARYDGDGDELTRNA